MVEGSSSPQTEEELRRACEQDGSRGREAVNRQKIPETDCGDSLPLNDARVNRRKMIRNIVGGVGGYLTLLGGGIVMMRGCSERDDTRRVTRTQEVAREGGEGNVEHRLHEFREMFRGFHDMLVVQNPAWSGTRMPFSWDREEYTGREAVTTLHFLAHHHEPHFGFATIQDESYEKTTDIPKFGVEPLGNIVRDRVDGIEHVSLFPGVRLLGYSVDACLSEDRKVLTCPADVKYGGPLVGYPSNLYPGTASPYPLHYSAPFALSFSKRGFRSLDLDEAEAERRREALDDIVKNGVEDDGRRDKDPEWARSPHEVWQAANIAFQRGAIKTALEKYPFKPPPREKIEELEEVFRYLFEPPRGGIAKASQ